MPDGLAVGFGRLRLDDYLLVHHQVLDLHPPPFQVDRRGVVCRRVEIVREDHVAGRRGVARLGCLGDGGPEAEHLPQYCVEVLLALADDLDPRVAVVVLPLSHVELEDLEVSLHIHDCVQNSREDHGVDEVPLDLYQMGEVL